MQSIELNVKCQAYYFLGVQNKTEKIEIIHRNLAYECWYRCDSSKSFWWCFTKCLLSNDKKHWQVRMKPKEWMKKETNTHKSNNVRCHKCRANLTLLFLRCKVVTLEMCFSMKLCTNQFNFLLLLSLSFRLFGKLRAVDPLSKRYQESFHWNSYYK